MRYDTLDQQIIVARRQGSGNDLEEYDQRLYDLSLSAGDVVPYNVRLPSWQNYTIKSVYPYAYDYGKYWKKYVLKDENGAEFEYIDGLGSFDGLISSFSSGLVSFHSDQFDYVP